MRRSAQFWKKSARRFGLFHLKKVIPYRSISKNFERPEDETRSAEHTWIRKRIELPCNSQKYYKRSVVRRGPRRDLRRVRCTNPRYRAGIFDSKRLLAAGQIPHATRTASRSRACANASRRRC